MTKSMHDVNFPNADNTVLRICKTCEVKHYDNCPRCFGFGVYVKQVALDGGGFVERIIPISADEAYQKKFKNTPLACPFCKSTYKGMPE